MAFALFRIRRPEPAAPISVAGTPPSTAVAVTAEASDSDSSGGQAKEILELLELELGALVRELGRAANSVAGGAQSTAATLSPSASAPRP
jgi:methyl-accepting chemotaxis protein